MRAPGRRWGVQTLRGASARMRSSVAVFRSSGPLFMSETCGRLEGKFDVRYTYTNFGQTLSNQGAAFQRIPQARKRPLPVASRKPSSATRSWAARGVIFSSAAIMPAEAMGRASM
jgi:hypothetical protein